MSFLSEQDAQLIVDMTLQMQKCKNLWNAHDS